uniref:Uncharacterized protein n=1 Tax=Strongyloides stercoralis TaxID=6248 RepID=A0AAF5PFP7_STRER
MSFKSKCQKCWKRTKRLFRRGASETEGVAKKVKNAGDETAHNFNKAAKNAESEIKDFVNKVKK